MIYHRTLDRQLRKLSLKGLTTDNLTELLAIVSDTYTRYDKDIHVIERAMLLSSEELKIANEKAKQEFEEKLIAQTIIREKEQMLNTINENVSEAVFRLREDNTFLFVNRAFVALFGFTSEQEALSSSLASLWQNDERTLQLSEKLLINGKIQREEILCTRHDNTRFWGLINLVSFINDDGKKCYDGAIVDITNQKNHEEELNKINQELDRLIYSIGHDLRAPIASTLGLINLSADETDIETVHQYNEIMRKSLLRLDNFIQDTLNYSRNVRTEIRIEAINIEQELNEINESLFLSTEIKGIEVEVNILGESICYTDKARLSIILNNLLSNAFRYHDKQKKDKFIAINANITETEINIQIIDNGQGIAKRHIHHIFDLFYRANSNVKGTGLGLHIVKEMVNKLLGDISVESELGKGTIFAINIPNQKIHFLKKNELQKIVYES